MRMNNMAPLSRHVTEQWHWPADLLQIRHNVWKTLGYPMRGRMRVQLLWRRVVLMMSGHALTQ
jgi:hypothetical protein